MLREIVITKQIKRVIYLDQYHTFPRANASTCLQKITPTISWGTINHSYCFSTVSQGVSVSALKQGACQAQRKLKSPFGVLQNITKDFLISIHLFNPLLSTDKFFGLGSFL